MRSMSVNKPMNQELIFLSISVRIHFAKMLCQEKGEFGCQLSPLAENGKTLLTHGKEMKISTVIVSTPIQNVHKTQHEIANVKRQRLLTGDPWQQQCGYCTNEVKRALSQKANLSIYHPYMFPPSLMAMGSGQSLKECAWNVFCP